MSRGKNLLVAVLAMTCGLTGSNLNAQSVTATQAITSDVIAITPPLPASTVTPPPAPPSVDTCLAWDATTKTLVVTNGTPEAHFIFWLTNIWTGDVVINDVHTSCGCTVAKLPEQPWTLVPGTNGNIQVTMNLLGKSGTVPKTVTVTTDKGVKSLLVQTTILPPPAAAQMSGADRESNQKLALADRQAVFRGECAKCHAEPLAGKMGQALYQAACGICHEAEHRATMVSNLHAIPQETNAAFWQAWITQGKPGSLMPAFSQTQGGPLTDMQIQSLVNYLVTTIPAKSAAMMTSPAPKAN
jgi:mono/diheme cytochrome c family protein